MVVCEIGSTGFGLPFAAVEACLFNHDQDSSNGMLGWADRFMQRTVNALVIEPSHWPGDRTGDLYLLGLNAGYCTAFCVHSALIQGDRFEPTLLRQSEIEMFVNWFDRSAGEAVEQGQAALEVPPLVGTPPSAGIRRLREAGAVSTRWRDSRRRRLSDAGRAACFAARRTTSNRSAVSADVAGFCAAQAACCRLHWNV